jgi:hypothetical protein
MKGLTELQQLTLAHTQVTDSGLAHLKGMDRLRLLTLTHTRVTDADVAELQIALPGLRIEK